MNILAHIHAYPPDHNAGAEWMQHSIFKWLVARGHECRVLTTVDRDYELDGVKVLRDDFDNNLECWRWADVAFTHLIRAGKAWNWSQQTRTPVVYTVHNTINNRLVEVKRDFKLLYNTEHAKHHCLKLGYDHKSIVVHPPVWFDDYHTNGTYKREYITLINCWERKGGKILVELAKAMPDRKFAGVMGGYGEQVIEKLPNLVYWQNTADMKRIYSMTRILIMPSVYESYGRTAVEAMCSGIPVVASGTKGLKESLGDCGIFTREVQEPEQLKVEDFMAGIESLDNEKKYNDLSAKSLKRAKELNERNETELLNLEKWLKTL